MTLDELRKRIDELDDEVARLLDERAQRVGEASQAKRNAGLPAYDPERERKVLDRLAARVVRFPADAIRAVYREVMSASLALQEPTRVAYLGPEGTFSHAAARALFGFAARYAEQTSIEGVFDAVARKEAVYGVTPIENSSEGSVTDAVDALLAGNVVIRSEFVMEVAHCLLTRAQDLSFIERVYSHPQALGQCRLWLANNMTNVQLVQTASTSAAIREAIGDERGAAIASRLGSEIHGLPVARERIQDRVDNVTRFVVIALEDAPPTGHDKTTLSFSLEDEKGALKRVLEIFEREDVNLTRIESRPSRQKAWDYIFLVELEGHRAEDHVMRAVEGLRGCCAMVRILGSYPKTSV